MTQTGPAVGPAGDPLRRQPRQARSQARIARILDTAEQVFAEVGYEAATTNMIAARAGTSIGSLYDFFPNKEAIARALAGHYTERVAALYEAEIVPRPDVLGQDLVRGVVAALDDFYRGHPGAVPLLNGRFTSPDLMAAGAALQAAMVGRIETVLAVRRPDVAPERRHQVAVVIGELARSLLVLAQQTPAAERSAVVDELVRALVGYLKETIPLPPGAVPGRPVTLPGDGRGSSAAVP